MIQISISTQFNCQKHFHFKLFKQLYVTIQLSVNTVLMSKNSSISNNSVKHKHALRARVDLRAMAMKRALHIPQSSSIAGTSPSDCLESYPGHSLGGGGLTSSAEKQSCILQPQPTGQTEKVFCSFNKKT